MTSFLSRIETRLNRQPQQANSSRISLPWVVTIGYLSLILFLPLAALIIKSLTIGTSEFWRIATDPVALSAYEVTFVT
ncbi:MAG: sulfate transporter, permease protein CysT, partial [Cyanobacteriota bacterium]